MDLVFTKIKDSCGVETPHTYDHLDVMHANRQASGQGSGKTARPV